MSRVIDPAAFDELYPFSFVTDDRGAILVVGRSLKKLYPTINQYAVFQEAFRVIQPIPPFSLDDPQTLHGELLILERIDDPRVRLRGQVVRISEDPCRFIFSLHPAISEAHVLVGSGLEFGDFSVGDPIFDFMMYAQSQRNVRKSLESMNARLVWETKLARLLHQITHITWDLDDPRTVFQVTVDAVRAELEWDIGHVFVREDSSGLSLRSASVWSFSDRDAFHAFEEASKVIILGSGSGFLNRAITQRQIVWSSNACQDMEEARSGTLKPFAGIAGVAVPVLEHGEVHAILEFFSRVSFFEPEQSTRFLETLALQIGNVLERQRLRQRERDQLAAMAQASKMATLGQIAAGVAHEINNPVSTISLIAHILKKMSAAGPIQPESLLPQVARIGLCVDRITKIVSELRAFSRDTSGDEFREVSIKQVIDETLDLCHARFESGDVKLIVGSVPVEWIVSCRDNQISQVLLNLLSNAYDAVEGRAQRWVKLEVKDRGDVFEFSVSDSGAGISPENVGRIMTPFFTTKPMGKGTGLGLSISSNIMTDHGGALRLDGSGSNTTFVATLPKRASHSTSAAA